jgi:Type III restriction enzyme, res subunit
MLTKDMRLLEFTHEQLILLNEPPLISNAHKISVNASTKIEELPQDYDLVIVDEAHHYPAITWTTIIDHFPHSKKLFLTATAERDGSVLPGVQLIHRELRVDLVAAGIIRNLTWDEVAGEHKNRDDVFQVRARSELQTMCASLNVCVCIQALADRIKRHVAEHDRLDPDNFHQAMVLTQGRTAEQVDRDEQRDAQRFFEIYNAGVNDPKEHCKLYITGQAVFF